MRLYLRLRAGLDAGDPVAHGVDAVFVGVGFFERLELLLAGVQPLSPADALGLAGLHHQRLGVLAFPEHVYNGVCLSAQLPREIDAIFFIKLRSGRDPRLTLNQQLS